MNMQEVITLEMAEAIAKRVDIDYAFTIIPKKNGDLILAEIKTNKETREQYYPALAVYQMKLALAGDFINRCIGRALWANRITCSATMNVEYNRAADLVFAALLKLQPEVVHG